MSLVTEWGRFDRASVTERAKEIYAAGGRTWAEARTEAYDEARRERFAVADLDALIAERQAEAAHV